MVLGATGCERNDKIPGIQGSAEHGSLMGACRGAQQDLLPQQEVGLGLEAWLGGWSAGAQPQPGG